MQESTSVTDYEGELRIRILELDIALRKRGTIEPENQDPEALTQEHVVNVVQNIYESVLMIPAATLSAEWENWCNKTLVEKVGYRSTKKKMIKLERWVRDAELLHGARGERAGLVLARLQLPHYYYRQLSTRLVLLKYIRKLYSAEDSNDPGNGKGLWKEDEETTATGSQGRQEPGTLEAQQIQSDTTEPSSSFTTQKEPPDTEKPAAGDTIHPSEVQGSVQQNPPVMNLHCPQLSDFNIHEECTNDLGNGKRSWREDEETTATSSQLIVPSQYFKRPCLESNQGRQEPGTLEAEQIQSGTTEPSSSFTTQKEPPDTEKRAAGNTIHSSDPEGSVQRNIPVINLPGTPLPHFNIPESYFHLLNFQVHPNIAQPVRADNKPHTPLYRDHFKIAGSNDSLVIYLWTNYDNCLSLDWTRIDKFEMVWDEMYVYYCVNVDMVLLSMPELAKSIQRSDHGRRGIHSSSILVQRGAGNGSYCLLGCIVPTQDILMTLA
jgi:hypothetical protein